MDDVRLKVRDGIAEDGIVLRLHFLQIVEARDQFVIVGAVQNQPPLHFAALLGRKHSMRGSEHPHRMAAQLEIIDRGLAPQVKRSGMMGRIQIGQDENLQASGGYEEVRGWARNNQAFEPRLAYGATGLPLPNFTRGQPRAGIIERAPAYGTKVPYSTVSLPCAGVRNASHSRAHG